MPDKRQRSIAAMFGAKNPGTPTVTIKGTTSSAPSTSKASSSKSASKNKVNKTSTPVTTEHLARVAYHKLQPVNSETFYSTLSAEFKELLELELHPENGIGPSYLRVLRAQLTKRYFLDLKRFLIDQGLNQPRNDIYPSCKNIYRWSRATPLDKIRVVIIGQDPYHGPSQAHGLSFSVPKGIPIPGSLRNIYQELKREYPEFKVPTHGTLNTWAESGVLLLNTSLTVKKGQAGSHSNKGWEQFTDAVVDAIDLYGGIGLINDKIPHELETDHPIEPSPKRVKLDGPSASQIDSHPFHDSKPSSRLASDSNFTIDSSSKPQEDQSKVDSLNDDSAQEKNHPGLPTPVSSDPPLTETAKEIKPQEGDTKVESLNDDLEQEKNKPVLPTPASSDPPSTEPAKEIKPQEDDTKEGSLNTNLEQEKNKPVLPTPVSSDPPLTEPANEIKPKDDNDKPTDHSIISTLHGSTGQKSAGFGQGVVFLCWGKWAADRVARLSESKHLILKSAHPSPLSAHRGFLGNDHFKLSNQWLEKKYGKYATIDWCNLIP